jgi:signal transduction histidine kinase
MGSAQTKVRTRAPLESVLCTEELKSRPARKPDAEAVSMALVRLARTMADSPERVLQQLVETAMRLCMAQSAGLSLLEEEHGRKVFRWHGAAGEYAPHLWATVPREFSPCGTVLDTNKMQLMSHLDRHFTYFADLQPHISEALLVPFHVGGKAIGTMWIVSHDQNRQFDAEDARVITTLGEFAAAAYQTVSGLAALKGIVATIREPLLVLDGSLRIHTASRSFYETFQVTPSDTEGQFLYQIGNGQWDIPELCALLTDVLPKERAMENFDVTRDFPLLGRRVMSMNARRISRPDAPNELILLAIEDITIRKRIEEELLHSNEDAQRFALVAAHDLRAPLNSAVMLLQFLSGKTKSGLDTEDRHLLAMATGGLQRLQSLMSDILSSSQQGSSQPTVAISLQDPLQTALTNLRDELEGAGAQIDFCALPSVRANHSQLSLVFQNLIGNAVKFRSDKPLRVVLGAIRENGRYVVSVADNGQGFDPRFADEIFLPFARLHGYETPGSGIGLTTCKRIIERMGGCIWAEGAPGEGATFYFTLPGE